MEDFIKNIKEPVDRYFDFRREVIEQCNVSETTFSNWSNGKAIESKYKPIINAVAAKYYGQTIFNEE